MEIKLNQAELDMVSKLDAATAKIVSESLLNAKRTALAEVAAAREVFSVSLSEFVQDSENGKPKKDASGKPVMKPGKGGFKVTGLGSRFPVTLYPEQWEIIFSNQEVIRACYNNPENKAKSDRLRK